ncbi:MAG: ABC transporter permease [Chloroflexia bacterium]
MVAVTQAQEEQRLAPAEAGQLAATWRRYRKHKLGLVGLAILALLMVSVIVVPIISPFTYDGINEAIPFQPAGSVSMLNGHTYWLGTDEVGRDNFTRLFYAGRISLAVGLITTVFVVIIGSAVGALAGYYGGFTDTALMRVVDLLLSLPVLPILLVLSQMVNKSGVMDRIFGKGLSTVVTIILVLTLLGWMPISRLVRGSILSLRSLDFVEASRALGASNRHIIMRHLMPNSAAPLIVAATLSVGAFIITEAFLSFLGLGIQAPTPSWGNLLQGAQEYSSFITDVNPAKEIRGYLILFPGLLILLTVLSINFMGDALRDALDPRLKM